MNVAPPSISLEQQLLTPAKVAWVLDAGETKVAELLAEREIAHFKKGRLIRIPPEALFDFILRNTRRAKAAGPGLTAVSPEQEHLMWQRIERLIIATVRGQEQKEAA